MKRYIQVVVLVLITGLSHAQVNKIGGRVFDPQTGGIPSVKIKLLPLNKVSYSDSTGSFTFTQVPKGSYTLEFSLVGYLDERTNIKTSEQAKSLSVTMHKKMHLLEEVLVAENSIKQLKASESLNLEVVDRSFIMRNLGGSLMETLSRLPGVKTIGIGSGQSKPLIRGLGFNRVVVVDKGIKHEGQQWGADHGLEIDQFAAREVELVKGAASFMYASDAIAGVINILPFGAPEPYSLGGSVDLIGKTNNGLYGSSVNLHGRRNKWFADTRITYQNYGDYRVPTDRVFVYDYAVDLHKNRLRNTAGRESGVHVHTGYINKNFQSTFYISNISSKSGFFANAHGLEPRRVDADVHDASSRDILMPSQQVNHFKVSNRSTLRVKNHLIEVELGYQHNFRQEFNHYVNHGYMPAIYPDTMSIPINLEREYDKHVYSANLRDKIIIDKHELTFGFNGEHQDNSINGWTFLVPAFRQTTAGVFLYDQYRVNSRTQFHGAIRYDHSTNRMKEYRDWFETPTTDGGSDMQRIVRAQQLTRNFQSFVWSAGLNYDLKKIALKANIGKSFRVPITKEFGANGVNYHYFSYEKGDPDLSPEVSYQLDLGAHLQLSKWSIGLSPFYNYFPNYIYLNPTPYHIVGPGAGNQLFQYSQSKVMRYGAELDIRYSINQVLSTGVLAEYLYAEQLSGDKKGFGLPFSPPPSALFNLTWSPRSNNLLKAPYLSLDYRATASQNNIVPPEKKTDGYGLFNVQLGSTVNLFGQEYIASIQIQNVFDTKYFNHTSFYRLIELPEAGRNFVTTVKVPFHIKSRSEINKI